MKNKFLNTPEVIATLESENYADAAKILFSQQYSTWKLHKDNYDMLSNVMVRSFRFGSYKIKVQFNPGRLTSTSAKVDEKSIRERKCFLCIDNLPTEQRGIPYKESFIILCNPFPIFPEHFTIVSTTHEPQRIEDTYPYLLDLTRHLSKYYSVVYNGPKCGASAPDHLHFQAGTKSFMPLDDEFHLLKNEFGTTLIDNGDIIISAVDDGLRKFLTIESNNRDAVYNWFSKLLRVLNSENPGDPESMINIVSSYNEETGWQMAIFIREKHRPTQYFLDGNDKVLISPASVDLAGYCITPDKNTFDNVNKEIIKKIFTEVFINSEKFASIQSSIRKIKN